MTDTTTIRQAIAKGEAIPNETILAMADELDRLRINEIVTTHYQGRMREILHAAG